jgi:hypothetical protein
MSVTSGAFASKAGFNQSGGAHFIGLSDVYLSTLQTFTPGSGSGGAVTQGSFAAFSWTGAGGASTIHAASGRILKDMGKTVISSGRTFRKFQLVFPQNQSTMGVYGAAASTTNPGYITGYLEVARDGTPGTVTPMARYY